MKFVPPLTPESVSSAKITKQKYYIYIQDDNSEPGIENAYRQVDITVSTIEPWFHSAHQYVIKLARTLYSQLLKVIDETAIEFNWTRDIFIWTLTCQIVLDKNLNRVYELFSVHIAEDHHKEELLEFVPERLVHDYEKGQTTTLTFSRGIKNEFR